MSRFKLVSGLRIVGDVVAVGGKGAVAEIDVSVNGRSSFRFTANRISNHSFQHGGSFFGGFQYALPMKSFKGGLAILTLTDTNSGLDIAEFEFTSDDYVFEEMMLALEYGEQVHSGDAIIPVAHTSTLAAVLPRYLEKFSSDGASRITSFGQPVLDWLLQLVQSAYYGAAIELLTALKLTDLIRADAIKVSQLFMRICLSGKETHRRALKAYAAKYPKLHSGDTYNMLSLCMRCKDPDNPPKLEELKSQLQRWRFSGKAMIVTFDFVELQFGKEALAQFKGWALQEWLGSELDKIYV